MIRNFVLFFLLGCGNALEWYDGGNFYQIYPRSYKDSNGDGIGDLQGIISKLQYVKDLGMDGLWLSPVMKSPQADFGYDISDYRDIHEEYGTLDDMKQLIAECKRIGLRLIMDFVPNHTSDEHEWFIKSENRVPGYEDYYIWRDGKIDKHTNLLVPPNNWLSFFRYSAWRWSEKRQQFYLHQFHYKQADLNYRDPGLVWEMKEVLRYWMELGISGFRIDIIVCLFETLNEDGSFPDEPYSKDVYCDANDACSLNHIHTQDRPETYEMAYQWRDLLNDFHKTHGGEPKVMMTESYAEIAKQQLFYGDRKTRNGSHIPFNFEMVVNMNQQSTAKNYKKAVDDWLDVMPKDVQANWVLGNHDQHRLASRLGVERGDLLNTMVQTLPGVAITYMGEELVMENVHLTWEETVDPQACNTNDPVGFEPHSRDVARTPFPWDTSTSAGFSTNTKTWLPVGNNYKTVNVQAQLDAPNSHLKIFKKLTTIRKQPVFRQGNYVGALASNDNVFVYKRQYLDQVAVVVLNFGATQARVNVQNLFPSMPSQLKVYTSSLASGMTNGATVSSSNIVIGSNQSMVLLSANVEATYN